MITDDLIVFNVISMYLVVSPMDSPPFVILLPPLDQSFAAFGLENIPTPPLPRLDGCTSGPW